MNAVEVATERAVLRPWRHGEAERLLDMRRRPALAAWLGDPRPWASLDQAHQAIDDWGAQSTLAVPGSLAIAPRAGGEPVGTITLMTLPRGTDEVQVGWYVHPDQVGKGWATEAATAIMAHGRDHGLARIWAVMWPNNRPSAAVCRRLGMVDLGTQVDPWHGTRQYPHSRVFVVGDDADHALADLTGWAEAADLPDDPDTRPPPDPAAPPDATATT